MAGPASDSARTPDAGKTYHVVRRDCRDERPADTGGDAQRLARHRADEADHRVTFARIE